MHGQAGGGLVQVTMKGSGEVVAQLTYGAAGFTLEAESDVLANPGDPHPAASD